MVRLDPERSGRLGRVAGQVRVERENPEAPGSREPRQRRTHPRLQVRRRWAHDAFEPLIKVLELAKLHAMQLVVVAELRMQLARRRRLLLGESHRLLRQLAA